MGFFSKLQESLKKTSDSFSKGFDNIFNKSKPDIELLESIEDLLLKTDVGIHFVEDFKNKLAKQKYSQESLTKENFIKSISDEIEEILKPLEKNFFLEESKKPTITLVCGVNGVGKTTTIGKIAKKLKDNGKKVVVGAADTFRAAAIDQLEMWCKKIDVPIIKSDIGSDPASVAYKALDTAKNQNLDHCIIDTAGRLQNKKNLMEEFAKIIRVLKKNENEAPHETILILDATTGQNALNQVEEFQKITPITGIIMAKLDGTAKGGILIAIAKKFKIPIYALGLGEKENDITNFNAKEFSAAIFKS